MYDPYSHEFPSIGQALIALKYDFNGTPWDNQDPDSQDWIYASEARQQQATVPVGTARPYPSAFRNGEDLPL